MCIPLHLRQHAWKMSKYRVISGRYFPEQISVFSPNTWKFWPKIRLNLGTFYAVIYCGYQCNTWVFEVIFSRTIYLSTLPRTTLITIPISFLRHHLHYGDIIYDRGNSTSFHQIISSMQCCISNYKSSKRNFYREFLPWNSTLS